MCGQKSGCMSRLLMRSGRYCRTIKVGWRLRLPDLYADLPSPRGRSGTPGCGFHHGTHSPAPFRRVSKSGSCSASSNAASTRHSRCRGCGSGTARCSSACLAYAGTSATRPGIQEFKAVKTFFKRLRRTTTDHITYVQLRHLIVREIDHAVAAFVQQVEDLFALFQTAA